MGRKKRKVVDPTIAAAGSVQNIAPDSLPPPPPPPLPIPPIDPRDALLKARQEKSVDDDTNNASKSSSYATTSHSAEIIDEDIYVSDGSESDEDLMADQLHMEKEDNDNETGTTPKDDVEEPSNTNVAGRSIEMILSGSKMGLMRRGIHRPQQLVQPNRQWTRQEKTTTQDSSHNNDESINEQEAEERRKREQEEELAKLDPAQRAAKLLAEKQRKLEEAKILARKLESEENAGRDPCLFSKRTSFDIRFDQIEDKPWERSGDLTDFFNYGFTEADWLEYAEQQMIIRQELIDASRQKRVPDPSIVPVTPKKPKIQNPRVAVATKTDEEGKSADMDLDGAAAVEAKIEKANAEGHLTCTVIGPSRPTKNVDNTEKSNSNTTAGGQSTGIKVEGASHADRFEDIDVGIGGAWGMGATPGSMLARLIEERDQEQNNFERQDATQDTSQTVEGMPRKSAGYYGKSNNHYQQDNAGPSHYGNGDFGKNSGYNNSNQQNSSQHHGRNNNHQKSHYGDNLKNGSGDHHRYQNNNDSNDWNNGNSSSSGRNNYDRSHHQKRHHDDHQQGWNDGGRSSYRGGGNRRGGSDYGSSGNRGRNRGGHRSERGEYHSRKRSRDDYHDRSGRR